MLYRTLEKDLQGIFSRWGNKMIFLSGPRQVGKTTLAQDLLLKRPGTYFNWDILTDQKRFTQNPYFFEESLAENTDTPLLVLDEIHKYARWKSYLKGIYDRYHKQLQVLVTGSGRLDIYKKGGDSLLGRYLSIPIFPLTVAELLKRRTAWKDFYASVSGPSEIQGPTQKIFNRLLQHSGFPDPYVKADESYSLAWRNTRTDLLVKEDIRDTSNIRNISLLQTLVQLLEPRVGSPLSTNALRQEVGVAFETVREWLTILENFYYFFRILPYSKKLGRLLRKEPKIYLFDWTEISDPGRRFENLVALHLFKTVKTWTAFGEVNAGLFYIRDKEKREVDFLVVANKVPVILVECKLTEKEPTPSLLYFQQQYRVPVAVQLITEPDYERRFRKNGLLQIVQSADRWLAKLV
jgi:hypothetical protein